MKIVLISVENTLVCFGVRMISAVLRQAGFNVKILFVPKEFNHLETEEELEKISDWILEETPDLLGVSLMSSHWRRVIGMHTAIRSACRCPIIWGGIHPTISPDECLEYADMVCIGEGEKPMLELVKAISEDKDFQSIPGIWVKRTDGSIIMNSPAPREDNLSSLPFPDHEDSAHRIFHGGRIQTIDDGIWRCYIPGFMDTHYVMSSRGCPHNCTYCCNSALRTITHGPYLRRRSPEHFIGEMTEIKAKYPNLKGFVFMDDSFFYGDRTWFESFCSLYLNNIDLPFFCWANPIAVTKEKIDMLVPAGLVGVHVGLESGSARVSNDIYQRKVTQDQFYKCMNILHENRRQIVDIRVDVITDNPYETEEEVADTVSVLSYLKKPFFVGIVSLIFYPKTMLEQCAIRDGLVGEGNDKLYNEEFFRYRPTLLNRLMRSVPKTPGPIIRFLLARRHSKWGRILFSLFYWGYFIGIRRSILRARRFFTLMYLRHMEHRMNPRNVVTTRVSLIDF
ncbi:B12-binding domain-containing radical SAM protein [bacterium]|nr:B12-binding domain-containing radical SAM protein [candidate division CSSED10-310 bacterium]